MTELTRRPAAVVYDRVAAVYDWYTAPMEALGGRRAHRRLVGRRAAHAQLPVVLEVADIEALPYPDDSFDTVTAACVFCSVGDPVRGLREAARVVRPDGQVLLYEHVRPHNPILGKLTDLVSPLTRRLFGPELNRPTDPTAQAAGLHLSEVRRHGM